MNVRIFVQSELLNDTEVVELPSDVRYPEIRSACLELLPSNENLDDFHIFVEDVDDDQELQNMEKIPDGLRVHIHRLRGIDVEVRYAGRDVNRTYRPSTTISSIKRWATQELGISASDAAELMLQIHGTDIRPDADVHVGSLVKSPDKSILFDLVPAPRING